MRIAISIGDVAGIGPEVILKALEEGLADDVGVVVFGDYGALEREAELLGTGASAAEAFRERFVRIDDVGDLDERAKIGVVDVDEEFEASSVEKGAGGVECARLQRKAFEAALSVVRDEEADAVVTAPWNKSLFTRIGEPVVGHTDILDDAFQSVRPVMMLAGDRLRVSLVTTHLPIERVASRVTRQQLRHVIRTTSGGLRRRFGIDHPEIAVCGLNPHAGEGGAMGDEEQELIGPVVDELRRESERSASLVGPLSADTLFAKFQGGAAPYDAVIAMYHDQGLIPLKLLHFGRAANVTLGLPIIRTSVDHGTAYDIAGEGVADPGSMRFALELAVEMVRRTRDARSAFED